MENIKNKIGSLVDRIEDYFNNHIEFTKLIAIEKGATGVSNAATFFILGFLGVIFIIFFSISLAIGLSMLLGSNLLGFLIVTFLYFIVILLLFYNREKWIIEPLSNVFIKNALKDYNDQNKQQQEV